MYVCWQRHILVICRDWQWIPKPQKPFAWCRHTHSFHILSWNSVSYPPLPYILWKRWLLEYFARTFSLVMQFSHESEHTKLMTLLIINFTLAVFHLQSLSCEAINKSQGEFLPIAIISLCALFAPSQFQLLDYFSKFPFLNFSLEVRKPAFPHGIPGCCGWCCRFCGWMLWRKKSTGIFVT